MAAGVVVVAAPGEGVLEAITHDVTGLVCPHDDAVAWCRTLHRVQTDDALATRLQAGARHWVEENFDAVQNAKKILARWRAVGP
jgi:glycosyltransferase involved in cell wall biosynthesis